MAVLTHPPGIIVEVVGIGMGDRGRSCEEHSVCGEVVEEDTLLHLRRVQIEVDGHKETVIAVLSGRASFGYCTLASEEKASEK